MSQLGLFDTRVPCQYTALFPFCGLGAGALGFLQAQLQTAEGLVRFRAIGGIDNDPLACEDFELLTKAPALCADISTMTGRSLGRSPGIRPLMSCSAVPPVRGSRPSFQRRSPIPTSIRG